MRSPRHRHRVTSALLLCLCARGAAAGASVTPRPAASAISSPAGAASTEAAASAVPPEASAGCRAAALPAARDESAQITVGGEERSYLVDAPAADGARPLPLVLAFHGFRDSAAGLRRGVGLAALAEREGFIAVHPEGHDGVRLLGGVGRGWDMAPTETRDLDFVRAVLDRLESERCVDRRRVFATGMSNGGFFANLLGCRLADRLAATAPVAGATALPACAAAHPLAVLLIFGRADEVISPGLVRGARDWWAQVAGCGPARERDGCTVYDGCRADLVACEGPQGHAWPAGTTERIWRFFQAHPRR